MKKITINDLVKKANETGYKTYLKNITTIRPYGNEKEISIYILDGESWEVPFMLLESDLEKEYAAFERIQEKNYGNLKGYKAVYGFGCNKYQETTKLNQINNERGM